MIDLNHAADHGPGLDELPDPNTARALRREAGVSAVEVANAVGVCWKSVSRWERGIRAPQSEAIRRRYGRVLNHLARSQGIAA